MTQRICIPVFNNRVAPLFDVSRMLLVFKCSGLEISERISVAGSSSNLAQRILLLKGLGVECVICSAISNGCVQALAHKGINCIRGVIGDVEEIAQAYASGDRFLKGYLMPGCSGARGDGYCRGGQKQARRGCNKRNFGGFSEDSYNSK